MSSVNKYLSIILAVTIMLSLILIIQVNYSVSKKQTYTKSTCTFPLGRYRKIVDIIASRSKVVLVYERYFKNGIKSPNRLLNERKLYLPNKYRINNPVKLFNSIKEFFSRLGINPEKLNYSITNIKLYRYDGFFPRQGDMGVYDYVWFVTISVSNKSPLIMDISALTGAIHYLHIDTSFYNYIDKHPILIINRTMFNYATKKRVFHSYQGLKKFYKTILWILGIDQNIYRGSLEYVNIYGMRSNITYPINHVPILYQVVDHKLLFEATPYTHQYSSIMINYNNDELMEIDTYLAPLKYFKLINATKTMSIDELILMGKRFLRNNLSIPDYISIEYISARKAYIAVKPWILHELIMIRYDLKPTKYCSIVKPVGREHILLYVLIDLVTGKIYDYFIV